MANMMDHAKVISVKNALRHGDIFTRLSAVIMGAGNICRKQIIKGLLYLAAEILFIAFMVVSGFGLLGGLTTLGTNEGGEVFNEAAQVYEYTSGDNSMLILLYGILAIIAVIAFVLLWRSSLKSAYQAQLLQQEGKAVPSFRQDLAALLDQNLHKTLLAGPIVCIIAFTILPLVFMAAIAFTNYDRNHQPPGKLFDWVGFSNFGKLLDSSSGLGTAFWHVLGWTIVWAVFATFLNYILGMILAIVINRQDTKWKSMWRFIFVLSIAIPQFVSLLVIRTMLQPEGSINVLLKQLGLIQKSLPFWTDVTWARITIIVVNLWVGVPYTMLQVTGILQNIPADLYEAARVDGANAVVQFFKITLPYMLFVTTPYLITQFIGNINNFNVIYLLTQDVFVTSNQALANSNAKEVDLLVTWLFRLTNEYYNYKMASTIGIIVFILCAVFTLIAFSRFLKGDREEAFR